MSFTHVKKNLLQVGCEGINQKKCSAIGSKVKSNLHAVTCPHLKLLALTLLFAGGLHCQRGVFVVCRSQGRQVIRCLLHEHS